MSESSRLVVVPAEPGFDLVEASHNDKGIVDTLVFIPIVAWVIEVICRKNGNACNNYAESVAHPVALETSIDSCYGTVIRTPTGRFVFCEHTHVDDDVAALAEFNRLRGSARKRSPRGDLRERDVVAPLIE